MKVAVMGYGTIGSGVVEVLEVNREIIKERVGEPLEVKKVLDLREFEGDPIAEKIVHDYKEIVNDDEISMVVETMGGVEPAYTFVKEMLTAGKHVTTSNKALVADKGAELIKIAREHKVNFMFEASVGGGIPIIRPLLTCLTGDVIEEISGIVNGTTNYMMTKMSAEGSEYEDVLKEAQALGYAEKDPTADVEGIDAARKIAVLASLAFNTPLTLKDVHVEGIDNIEACDIEYARDLGYVVKLLGVAKNDPENGITANVYPVMLPKNHPLASVNDVYNAIYVNGDAVGDAMFMGRGAGRMPTASAVCSDIIDISRNILFNACGRVNSNLFEKKKMCPPEKEMANCYFRLLVTDRPGVLAAIASTFAAQQMSIASVIQKNVMDNGTAELVIITNKVSKLSLDLSLRTLQVLPVVKKVCSVLRVEDPSL